jgi:ubiquinone/menaquinone biosynthesis C-methylase UbiE
MRESAIMSQTCPACNGDSRFLSNWTYSGLGESIFNYTAEYFECPDCGLVYVANITDQTLSIFYQSECSYSERSHFDIHSPENINKYGAYRKLIVDFGMGDVNISDIGCGRGGFITWLVSQGWRGLCVGVDIDTKSIPSKGDLMPRGSSVRFKNGGALNLPFEDNSQTLLTYFHVLEHIKNIDGVLAEAFRVLDESGSVLIEVPDAERYKDVPVGGIFWFSIREHIFHYSVASLVSALSRNGFSVRKIERSMLPTPEFIYPSLIIIANKSTERSITPVKDGVAISEFLLESKKALIDQSSLIQEKLTEYSKLVFWGCSNEFFSLFPCVKNNDLVVCDISKIKQSSSIQGMPIRDPNSIDPDGMLVIPSCLHGNAIEDAALKRGWKRENIVRLN